MLRSAAARRSALFFLLKLANTGLATLWSFLLTYSLVRTVGLEDYAFFATIIAFAALVLQADLGISLRLFGRLRQNHLQPDAATRQDLGSATLAALWSYAAVAVAATALFAALLWGAGLGAAAYRPVSLLIFAGSVLPLPWMVLRLAVNAFEHYVLSEGIDFARRVVLVALTGALALGLPLTLYAAGFLLLWLGGLLVLLLVAWRRMDLLRGASPRRGLAVLRANAGGIGASALLSVSEFLIYIFPYYTIPLTHRGAASLVAFDMFYKVTRFGTTAFLTVAETLLPHQTRAFHARDRRGLLRAILLSFALGAVPLALGAGVILLAGDLFFGLLLGDAGIVTPLVRGAIALMLLLMLVQTASGAVLAGIGWLAPLARRAASVLGLLLLFAALSAQQGWSIESFILGYTLIYGLEALAYFLLMLRMLWELPDREAPEGAHPA